MKTTIYYFSATGNSLQMARNIAKELDNCELISIAKAIQKETIETPSERIGLIFPVYAWGIPRIVKDFVMKLGLNGKSYVFAIATCVAIPGNTLLDLQRLLKQKGADLNAGFVVSAGCSSLMNLNVLDKIIVRLDRQRKKIKNGESRLIEIVTTLKNLEMHRPESSSWAANSFGSIFHNMALKSFKTTDSGFIIKDTCNGCGNCTKVCPRSNITIENNRPIFYHNCELCHACIQWCPNFAIQHPNFNITLQQYHNPAILMSDIIAK